MSVENARAAAKAAFKSMMDAATKAANLAFVCAEAETDPTLKRNWLESRDAWQNSAAEAARQWRNL